MKYHFVSMTSEYANEIAYKWRYKGKYSFYNIENDKEDLGKFINPENWDNIFAAIVDENKELLGFSTYVFENEIMWIGFGLKPNFTGKGLGSEFVEVAIKFGIEYYNYQERKILLCVAEFNKRAIKVYNKVGFRPIDKKELLTNGRLQPFIIMGKAT